MNRLKVVTAMALLSTVLTGAAASASPLVTHSPVHAMFGRTKTVSFNLRNDTAGPVKIKAGDQEMTLQPGKITPVKLNLGEKVLLVDATPTQAAGAIVTTAQPALSDATVSFK